MDLTLAPDTNVLELNFTLKNIEQPPFISIKASPCTTTEIIEHGIWHESLQMFIIEFKLPARMISGPLYFSIYYPPFLFSRFEIPDQFKPYSELNITSKIWDSLPPLVSDISVFPSNDLNPPLGSPIDLLFGWNLTIEDSPNGLKSALIEVSTDFDFEPYVFEFNISNLLSGDIYKGVYQISIPIQAPGCASQIFTITKMVLTDTQGLVSSTFNLATINPLASFSGLMTNLYSIKLTCPLFSDKPPGLYDFRFIPDTIDPTGLSNQRTINFTIISIDFHPKSLPYRPEHVPSVYLQTSVGSIVSKKSVFVSKSPLSGTVEYFCSFEVPYGFGIGGQGIIASVYGLINSNLAINGFSAGDLINLGFKSTIKTLTIPSFQPILTSSNPVKSYQQKVTIFGYGFGSVFNELSVYFNDGSGYKPIKTDLFSGIAFSLSFQPNVGESPFKVKVIINGKESNEILIQPIIS
eukprot:gene9667-11852_t